MEKILALLAVSAVAVQAFVIPGMSSRGMNYGNPYADPLSFSELAGGVAGGVANSMSGIGGALGGLGGHLGNPLNQLRGPLGLGGGPMGGVGGPLGRSIGYGPGAYNGAGLIAPQGLSMDYGFLRG